MTSGPMGPATDLLGEVRFQLLMLNEQIRNLVELERRELPAPQVTVEPTPVVVSAAEGPVLDLLPLLNAVQALDRSDDRGELQALRREFSDLATAIRHIAGSQSVGSGSSFVTAQTRNEPGQTLHVTVDALPASGAATDVSDRAARLLGHVTVDNLPATQPVSIATMPSTPVTGTFFQATQPVSLATNTPDVTDRAARLLGHVTVDSAPTTAVTGTFWQATQPVSLAANQSINSAQVNGATLVTSVTGVQDVMNRKRTGATGLSPVYSASHITTNATTNVTAATAYVSTIAIVVSGIGSAWTIKILNKEATAKILYPATTAALGVVQFNFSEPLLMTSGIDIVTAGTTAGTVDVFVTYWQ